MASASVRNRTTLVPVPGRFPTVTVVTCGLIAFVFIFDPPVDVTIGTGEEWWRLLAGWVVHRDPWHVFVNVWLLLLFGWPLERNTGAGRTLIVFVGGCVLGNLTELVLASEPVIVLGASGGVYALVGVWLSWSTRRVFTPVGGSVFGALAVFLAVATVAQVFSPGTAWRAHAAGVAWGAICQRILRPEQRKPSD